MRRVFAIARNTWRTLTSMGTALVLLFLLAMGAIPGALLPQRSLNEAKVEQYIAEHPTIGPWLDRVQAFGVFSSFWFTAIYVLLFVSLVGCLTPRLLEHVRSLRATPVPAPRNLGRLPKHHSAEVAGRPEAVAATVSERLTGWRRTTRSEGDTVEISAEKGYLREFGNIVFHFALLGLLVSVAVGKLFGYEGNVIVVADGGPGFCSASPAAFDSFRAGNTVDGTSLNPICLRVNDFDAHYLPSGQALSFAANIDYQEGDDLNSDTWRPYHLKVNEPLRIGGDRVYLQGHGYAPDVHGDVPRRPDPHTNRAVAAGRSAHSAVVGCHAVRPAGRHLPRRRRAPQASDRDPGAVRADRAAARQPCCRRVSPRSTIPPLRWTSIAATPGSTPGGRSRCSRSTRG